MGQQNPVALMKADLGKMHGEFAKALPGHITADKFVRTAQTAIALTRNIEKVKNPQSLLSACSKAAADGLILDGREAALVIDYNGDVQYRPMMRGLLKLAWQSGEVKGIVVEIVRKGDIFRHSPTNLAEPIKHEINHEVERGEPYVVYAFAELKDGGIVHEVMSVSDVNAIRDRSDAYRAFKAGKIKSTPWHTDWSEMARKTVFRRLSKYLPSSSDRDAFRQAVERIDDDYSFEADADANGEVGPVKQEAGKREDGTRLYSAEGGRYEGRNEPAGDPRDEPDYDYDRETGEIYRDEGNYAKQPQDDI